MSSNRELDKSVLFKLLKYFDEEAKQKITLIAAGGTAMTLLDLKTSTLDIDFTLPSCDKMEFDRIRSLVPHGFKIDMYTDGLFSAISYQMTTLGEASKYKNLG